MRSNAEAVGPLADVVWHRVHVVRQIRCGVIGGTQAVVIQSGLSKELSAQIHSNAATKRVTHWVTGILVDRAAERQAHMFLTIAPRR